MTATEFSRALSTARKLRLNPTDVLALSIIAERETMNCKELCAALNSLSASVTNIGDRLAELGYIVRSQHFKDRRSVILTIHASGQAALEKILNTDPQ